MRVEPAREDLVCVSRRYTIANLLNFLHPIFIIDLYVGLRAGNNKAAGIARVINSMVLLFVVEHDTLDRVALVGSPTDNATVEASTEKFLRMSRLITRWLPRQ